MRDLCVFDLDGTLIPYDSFSQVVKRDILSNPRLLSAALCRKLGLMGRSRFAETAHRLLKPKLSDLSTQARIISDIKRDIIAERAELIRYWRKSGAYLVLLSASPDDYVKSLGAALGFDQAIGSHWLDDRYVHLHGSQKRLWIDHAFPGEAWRRAYAIADQPSDEPLLSAFIQADRLWLS